MSGFGRVKSKATTHKEMKDTFFNGWVALQFSVLGVRALHGLVAGRGEAEAARGRTRGRRRG